MKTYTYNEAVSLFTKADFIYKIYNEIDLEGHTLTLPSGCTLDFQGGLFKSSTSGGTLVGNETMVIANGQDCFDNVTQAGSWNEETFSDKPYLPESYSGLGKVYLKKNMGYLGLPFDRFFSPTMSMLPSTGLTTKPDEIVFVPTNAGVTTNAFWAKKGNLYYSEWSYGEASKYMGSSIYNGDFVCKEDGKPYTRSASGQTLYEDTEADKVNILTQSMMDKENTIYVIQYDYDLNGESIEVPEGCMLDFQGGSFGNGTLNLNNTTIYGIRDCLNGVIIKGNYIGSLAASWIGLLSDNSTAIIKNLDTILVNKRHITLDSNINFDSGEIILPSNTYINGNGYDLKCACQNNTPYLFALSNNVSLKNVRLYCKNSNFEGIILYWATNVFKGESPVRCNLQNVSILCEYNNSSIYKSTGLYMLCTASGNGHHYIFNCNIYNLHIMYVKDGIVIENNNTDVSNNSVNGFAWSNTIYFDHLYVRATRRVVSLLEINPNNVGNSIGPYYIENLEAQAINTDTSSPIVYYLDTTRSVHLGIGTETAYDYHEHIGELHGKAYLSINKILLTHFSFDKGLTDDDGTYDYIQKIKKYSGTLLSIPTAEDDLMKLIKPNYDNTSDSHVVEIRAVDDGFDIIDDIPWYKSGNIEYRRGNSTIGDRNCFFNFYRDGNNGVSVRTIISPKGLISYYYDAYTGGFNIIDRKTPYKKFQIADAHVYSCSLFNYSPYVVYKVSLQTLVVNQYYSAILKIKNASFNAISKRLDNVLGTNCEIIKFQPISNTTTTDAYSTFIVYFKANAANPDLTFLIFYSEILYKSADWFKITDLDYLTDSVDATVANETESAIGSILYEGYKTYDSSLNKIKVYNGSSWVDSDGNPADAAKSGTYANAPTSLLGTNNKGFEYFATDLGCQIFWTGTRWVQGDGYAADAPRKGDTASRPKGIGATGGVLDPTKDYGFEYFDISLTQPKPIYASSIALDGTVTWTDATGATA